MKRLRALIPAVVVAILILSGIIGIVWGFIAALTTFFCMVVAIYIGASWFIYYLAISRKSKKTLVFSAPHNECAPTRTQVNEQRRAEFDHWLRHITIENTSIKSQSGLTLYAHIIRSKPESSRWVVICHGYASSNDENMLFVAQSFHEMGYCILMPDARGHGKSEGKHIGMGWLDRLDIVQWIKKIGDTYNVTDIVLYGVSMGAASVLMTSGEPLPPEVKAVIADCGYTSAMKEILYQMKSYLGISAFLTIHLASLFTRIFAGYWLGEASALRQLAKSKTPTLLIHGSADSFVPPYMLEELYNAARCPKQKMLVEGAGHGQSAIVERTRYWQTINDFLAKLVRLHQHNTNKKPEDYINP